MEETPINNSVPPEPPSPTPRLSIQPIYTVLTLIFGVLLGAGGLFAYQEYMAVPPVSTYEECINAKGSVIQESYPATCVTRDKKRFTQPLTEEEKQKLIPPGESSTWQTYINAARNYRISYPGDWTIDSSKAETPLTAAEGASLSLQSGSYQLTILWPSAFGPGICYFDDQNRAEAPEMASFCKGEFTEFISDDSKTIYRRLVAPESFGTYVQWQVYAKQGTNFVTVPPTKYRGPIEYDRKKIQEMDAILQTFTASSQETNPVQSFTCPKTAWVDCMPGPDRGIKLECTDEYLAWAKTNCPNFEGAAL